MTSLLLRNVVVAATNTTRFLNRISTSRLFSSWLLGRSQCFSPLQALTATEPHGVDRKPFLASCPLPGFQCAAGMKSKLVLRKRCKDCFFVRRRGRLYVYCKTHPRHKQRQM